MKPLTSGGSSIFFVFFVSFAVVYILFYHEGHEELHPNTLNGFVK